MICAVLILVDQARSNPLEQSKHARANRPTGHLQHQWIVHRVFLAFEEQEEQILWSNVEPYGFLRRACVRGLLIESFCLLMRIECCGEWLLVVV